MMVVMIMVMMGGGWQAITTIDQRQNDSLVKFEITEKTKEK
jgi:hypothetical protein